jgi:hypothetical protein
MSFNSLTNPQNIQSNRQGTVTTEQYDLLRLSSGLRFWFASGSAAVITGIVFWWMKKQSENLTLNAPHIPFYFWIVLAIAVGTPLLYLGFQMVRSARTRKDLASGMISFEEGQIEWTGRQYRLQGSLKGLRSVFGPVNAMPGHYRFYFLPTSRTLLAAEPLEAPPTMKKALTAVFGLVLGFTPEDLIANRTGLITPAQSFRLRPAERQDKIVELAGPGSTTFRTRTRSAIKSYLIGHERFDVSSRAYHALVEGETYRIIYLANTKKILSIEAI